MKRFWLWIAMGGGAVRKIDRIEQDWMRTIADLLQSGALTRRQRRFARMGRGLARYRYAREGDWMGRTRALYSAIWHNPAAVAHPSFPRRELLPGRDPVWKVLSGIKRAMGIAPRGVSRTKPS
jgi:hypothetical protein